MSGTTGALVLGGALVVAAGLIGWGTWRVRRSRVVWRRVPDSRLAHAIRRVELRAGAPEVDAVGFCGVWPVAELERARRADERCPACVREVEALERGGT